MQELIFSDKKNVLKAHYNHIRLVVIREKMKEKGVSIRQLQQEVLPEMTYGAARNIFKPPFHVSEKVLGRIEKHLRISSFDVLEAFEAAGLSIARAQELGVRIGPED